MDWSRFPNCAFAILIACSFAGCATYSKVTERPPRFRPIANTVARLTNAEAAIVKALQIDRSNPLAALSEYMSAAETALRQFEQNPHDEIARNDYNFAVARMIDAIGDQKLDPWTQPLRIPASSGDFVLTHKPDPRPQWNPALYHFTPADQFDLHGTYVTERTTRDGIGAPLVAVGREANQDARANFSLPRTYYGVTAIARFEGRRCVLSFEDPLAQETVQVDGHTYPLAADFTVPLAVMLASTDPKKLELARLLNPAKYAETARISRLQPYDPNKAVVLVVHGLMDSPATWTPMLNTLRGDADIRRNYQFWFYSYPSGYPYPYSASILRRELDAVEKRFPLRKPMVRHRPQHGRLHQSTPDHRLRGQALDEAFQKAAGTGAARSRCQGDLYRVPHLSAPPGNRTGDLHFRALARQRSRGQLGWPDRVEPCQSTFHPT